MDILTLLKANIRYKKGAFSSIIILMFILSLALCSVISNTDNIRINLNASLDHVGVGDFVAWIDHAEFTEELKNRLEEHQHVDRVENTPILVSLDYQLSEENNTPNMIFLAQWDGKYRIFNESTNGYIENPPAPMPGEIYVPLPYQALYQHKIGDTIIIRTKNGDKPFIIKGFVEEPFIGAYVIGVKQVFISKEDFDSMFKEDLNHPDDMAQQLLYYQSVQVFQADDSPLSITELQVELNRSFNLSNIAYASVTKESSIGYTTIFTDIGGSILYVFLMFLFVIILLVMGHSLSGSIQTEYQTLGILKSQGFTKRKIRTVFFLQYFIAFFLGTVLGVIGAVPLTVFLGRLFQPITGILATGSLSILKCGLVLLLILFICSVFVLFITRKIGRISPVKAISGSISDVYFYNRLRFPITKTLLSATLALRQFTSNKRRYIGTILVVILLVFFMMSISILTQSLSSDAASESIGMVLRDLDVYPKRHIEDKTTEEIKTEISKITPISSSVYIASRYFVLNDWEYQCQIYNDPSAFRSIVDGRAPKYDNEIVITEIVAEELKVKIGDIVTVSGKNGSEQYIITGYFQSGSDLGRCFSMLREGALRISDQIHFETLYFRLEDVEKAQEVADMLNERFKGLIKAEVFDSYTQMEMTRFAMDMVTLVIYIISCAFALVVVVIESRKFFLKERYDMGIYKAVGFPTQKLRIQFTCRFLLLSVLGGIIGIVLCLLFHKQLIGSLLRAAGMTHFATEYNSLTFILPTVVICFCFAFFSYLSSKKIKSVSTRELITE